MDSRGSRSLSRPKTALGTTKHRVIGGISQVLLAAYGFLTIVGGFSIYQIAARGNIVVPPPFYGNVSIASNYFETLGFSNAAASIIFLTFVILLAYPVTEASRRIHGGQVGDAAIPFAFAAFPVNMIYSIALYNGNMYYMIPYDGGWLFVPYNLSFWYGIVSLVIVLHVLTGITIALFGASFVLNSNHFSKSKLWKTTGVLYLITAALIFSVLLDLFGAIAAFAAGIFGIACFTKGSVE